jgi:hypothetical protein
MKKQAVFILMAFCSAMICSGEGKQEQEARRAREGLSSRHQRLVDRSNELAVDIEVNKLSYPSFDAVTNNLNILARHKLWRDLYSRETRIWQQANQTIKQALDEYDVQLNKVQKSVALIKKAKYEEWALTHPEAAKINELEKRTKAAEWAAGNASAQASEAYVNARKARMEAQNAQDQATRAQIEARNK